MREISDEKNYLKKVMSKNLLKKTFLLNAKNYFESASKYKVKKIFVLFNTNRHVHLRERKKFCCFER